MSPPRVVPLNSAILDAYKVLEGKAIDRPLADRLAAVGGEQILDLLSLANKVRNAFSPDVHICTIMNAKSGHCSEDCRFCAQSAHNSSVVEVYELATIQTMLEHAARAYATGVRSFGIVTSGTGYLECNADFRRILDAVAYIRERWPDMHLCASLGVLSERTAAALAEGGVEHYNINLQTNPARYGELIASTHDVAERFATVRHLKGHGVKVCCGGIVGLGESMADRIELAYTLRDLDVDVIPLNVLVPIPGTPLEDAPRVPVAEIAKTFALFRLINPRKTIKFAAGRETTMRDFQGLLMLAGPNGFLTGGYLTTRGRDVAEDMRFRTELEPFAGCTPRLPEHPTCTQASAAAQQCNAEHERPRQDDRP